MTALIIPKTAPSCGNCNFGKPAPYQPGTPAHTECWGAPPTPVVLGMGQNMAGQPAVQIELLRPRIPSDTQACALWREKLITSALGGAMKGNG